MRLLVWMIICFLNSALDAESEKIVQEALDYAVKGNNAFINEDPLKYIIFILSIFLFCISETWKSYVTIFYERNLFIIYIFIRILCFTVIACECKQLYLYIVFSMENYLSNVALAYWWLWRFKFYILFSYIY